MNRTFLVLIVILVSFGCKRAPRNTNNSTFTENVSENYPDLRENLPPLKFKHTAIASWNIRHLGKTKTADDIYQIANILRDFDIVAIQEVVAKDPAGAQAVAKIADELNRMGSKWDYQISNPTKSPSANICERYAFLWKTAKVSIQHRAYLDAEMADLMYREPFIAEFKAKGESESFYLLNYHSRKYNDRPEDGIVHFIEFPFRLKSERIIIAGDFNLSEKHQVWEPFYRDGFQNALADKPTTLKRKCKGGVYLNNSIDNLYFTSGVTMMQSGAIDFLGDCEILKRARKISDHIPVFMEFKIEE